jgi:hypothetical protein
MRILTLSLRGLAVLALLVGLAPAGVAAPRRISLPAAFRPDTLNSVTPSPTEPVAFAASRETDSVFAFDPRTGAMLGYVEVGDGPLFVRLREEGGRRTLAVSCDGLLSTPQNLIAVVDATDPTHMRVTSRALVPREYEFLLGYSAVHFSPDGLHLLASVTEQAQGTAHGVFVTFDVATGREVGRVDIGFVPSSAALAVNNGRVLVAVSHATAPHGRVTIVDATNPAAPSILSRVTLRDGSAMFNVNNVELSADGRTGYVCAATTGFLYTFDVETGQVLAYDATGAFATAVHAFEQNGQPRLLVVAEESAAAFVWDVSDPRKPRLLSSFYSGTAFFDSPASVTRDGKMAFVTSSAEDQVIAIDLVSGQSTYNEVVGNYPVGTAVWDDGEHVYVSVLGALSNDVNVLEATTRGFRRRGVFDGAPGAVQFGIYQNVELSGDGRFAFVASTGTGARRSGSPPASPSRASRSRWPSARTPRAAGAWPCSAAATRASRSSTPRTPGRWSCSARWTSTRRSRTSSSSRTSCSRTTPPPCSSRTGRSS